jgi:hypothetical protein
LALSLRQFIPWRTAETSELQREVRTLKAQLADASGALRYVGGRGLAPKRGTRELLQAYTNSPWVRAIAKRVGDAVAGVEFRLYRQTGKGSMPEGAAARRLARIGNYQKRAAVRERMLKQAQLEQVEAHPFLDFLDRGNGSGINGPEARALAQIQVDLVGVAPAIIETTGKGEPSLWYPLSPHWIEEAPRPGQKYEFRIQVPGGPRTTIPGENMLWICDRDPADPYGLGTGVGRALADEIDTDEFVAKFVKNTFFNDATPGMLVVGEGLSPDMTKALEEKWLQKLQGIFKGRRPLFLNKDVKVHQMQRTFEELQLTDLRKWERDICMQVWGIPPEILGVIESSNRATIESAAYLFQLGVVLPRAEKMRATLNAQVVSKYQDPSLYADFESPVSEDKEHARTVYSQAPWAFSVDEHRALAGADALEGDAGRVFPNPLGLLPADEPLQADLPDPVAEEPDPEADPEDEEPDEDEPEDEPEEEPAKAAPARVQKRELTESEIQQILRSVLAADLASTITPSLRRALVQLGQATVDDLGLAIRFNEASPRVVEFLRHEGARLAKVNVTTQRALRSELVRGTQAGDSFDDLAVRINRVFEAASNARARTIARTESVRASNFGALEGMQQGGIEQKQWLSARDERAREAHAPGSGLDGVTIPIGAEFVDPINGSRGMHPGAFPAPESSINCRCVLLSVHDDRAAASTEPAKVAHWKRHESRRAPYEGEIVRSARRGFEKQRKSAQKALGEISE